MIVPETGNLRHVLKILISGFLREAHSVRISEMAIVLVQVFRDKVHIHLYETLTPFVHEFHLGRFGVFCAGHLGEVMGDGCFNFLTLLAPRLFLEFPRFHFLTDPAPQQNYKRCCAIGHRSLVSPY